MFPLPILLDTLNLDDLVLGNQHIKSLSPVLSPSPRGEPFLSLGYISISPISRRS